MKIERTEKPETPVDRKGRKSNPAGQTSSRAGRPKGKQQQDPRGSSSKPQAGAASKNDLDHREETGLPYQLMALGSRATGHCTYRRWCTAYQFCHSQCTLSFIKCELTYVYMCVCTYVCVYMYVCMCLCSWRVHVCEGACACE